MATKKASSKTAKKAAGTKSASRTTAAKKTARKSGKAPSRGAAASRSVEREMKAMKSGELTSGRSGKKVTNPKQAIAIGLSEARKKGVKVPPHPHG